MIRIQQGHRVYDPHFDREAAEMLAHRGTESVEDGHRFVHGPQLNNIILGISEEVFSVFFSSICCPILVIL